VLNGDLEAIRARRLEPVRRRQGVRLAYDASLINCDADVERLARGELSRAPRVLQDPARIHQR